MSARARSLTRHCGYFTETGLARTRLDHVVTNIHSFELPGED